VQRAFGRINSNWLIVTLIVVAVGAAFVAVLLLDTTGKSGSGLSEDYLLNLRELAKVDPNLILYTEVGTPVKLALNEARAIALDSDGRMYIAGDSVIHILSNTGNPERMIELSGRPQCLTVTADGKVYIGLEDHVEVYDGDGSRLASWEPLGDETVLTSIAEHDGNVFVADAGHRIVLHYDAAGTLIGHIGEKDPDRNIPGFFIPSPHFDLAVSRDGLLRVVDPGRNRIEAYTLDGDLEFWWGKRSNDIDGFCGCCNPVNFALLPNGGFVTAEKGLERVKVYNSDGGFVGVVAGPTELGKTSQLKICETPEECRGRALDVAAGADGRVYILDTTENVVRIFQQKEASQ